MEQLSLLLQAYGSIFSQVDVLGAIAFGTVVGVFLGAIPGLTSTVGIALMLPFTFYMSPLAAICMARGIYKGGTYGGSIPAILLRVPGTPAAACTQIDGHELAKQGKQLKALRMAVIASATADICSDIVLIFFTIYIANVALKFGPPEFVGVLIFALTMIGGVTGKSPIKGLLAALAGLFIGTIGLDPMTAVARFSFGVSELSKGINLVALLIGAFCVSEVFVQAERKVGKTERAVIPPPSSDRADNRVSWREFKEVLPAIFRSYGWGQLIGILPGMGAAISPWIGYSEAKRTSKHPERFGKGSLEGVAAPEAANNAVCGANLMPTLTLGVPGSTDAALIMSIFLIHGLRLGPRIFVDHAPLVYGIFAAGPLAIGVYLLTGLYGAALLGKAVAKVSKAVIFPVVFIMCAIGTYAVGVSLFDVGTMVGFGVLGYLMRKYGFSVPAFVIAFMLGSRFETELRRSLLMSHGSPVIFFTHPIALGFILLTAGSMALTVWSRYRKRPRKVDSDS